MNSITIFQNKDININTKINILFSIFDSINSIFTYPYIKNKNSKVVDMNHDDNDEIMLLSLMKIIRSDLSFINLSFAQTYKKTSPEYPITSVFNTFLLNRVLIKLMSNKRHFFEYIIYSKNGREI